MNPQATMAPQLVTESTHGHGAEPWGQYGPGGFHPIHLGDWLGPRGRFRVVNKLGHGGYGSVWLCEDTRWQNPGIIRWKAVKVMRAKSSTHDCSDLRMKKLCEAFGVTPKIGLANGILIPEEYFFQCGPAGRHLCMVYPVMGRSLRGIGERLRWKEEPLKNICRRVVEALQFVHSIGICHGDFRTPNILLQVQGLENLSKSEMLALTGQPQIMNDRVDKDWARQDPRLPRYLVVRTSVPHDSEFVTRKIAVTDFGLAFHPSKPPSRPRIPMSSAAPEWFVEGDIGFGTDIWSLGCTLCDIRYGSPGFNSKTAGDILKDYQDTSGPLPERYVEAWKRRALQTKNQNPDCVDEDEGEEESLKLLNCFLYSRVKDEKPANGEGLTSPEGSQDGTAPPGEDRNTVGVTKMCPREAFLFHDLLQRTWKWLPEDRYRIRDILGHGWFWPASVLEKE